jgi:hypothetical protein
MKSILLFIVVFFSGVFWLSDVNISFGTEGTDYEGIIEESELANDEEAIEYTGNEEETIIEGEITQDKEEDNEMEQKIEERNEELDEDIVEYKGNKYE